jgi:hypothetical protein
VSTRLTNLNTFFASPDAIDFMLWQVFEKHMPADEYGLMASDIGSFEASPYRKRTMADHRRAQVPQANLS